MNNWGKTSLITTTLILLLIICAIYLFEIKLSLPSFDIEFSPGPTVSKIESIETDSLPKNIIVFIADGMGFGHLSLALQTQQSENEASVWQEFDVKGWHDARAVVGPLTDSEASATAMATGTSTQFGHIGITKDRELLNNIFEIATKHHFATGIVTDSYIWDGTPAAFVAHTRNEDDAGDILTQIASSQLDLIFGELEDVGEDDVPEKDESMEILKKRFKILDESLTLPVDKSLPVAAIYDEDEVQDLNSKPNLTLLTETALQYISSQNKPFLLLVESEEMDAASHENDSERVVNGLQSIQETLSLILNFSNSNKETLVVFTADHETGGLAAVSDFDRYPKMQIRWSSKEHTAAVVPIFAKGPGAEQFAQVQRNWEIGALLKMLLKNTSEKN